MAGRPKMMARRVWGLKVRFEELISEFNRLCPEMYRVEGNRPPVTTAENDVISFAWQEAHKAVNMVEYDLEFLADMLYTKAEIPTPRQEEIGRQLKKNSSSPAEIGSA